MKQFPPIEHYDTGMIEVQRRLQKALHFLSQVGNSQFRACAKRQSRLAVERALETMAATQDKARLKEVAAWSE